MNRDKYTELTGIVIPDTQHNLFKAQVRRQKITLETMLGFTLDRSKINTNIYNEVGKTSKDCFCLSVNTSTDNLLPPDEVVGSYRLFRYNKNDRYFEVDPFTAVHAVKLVRIGLGDEDESHITIKTFDKDRIRLQMGNDGVGKYIEKCMDCMCDCACDGDCVQVAVDADWIFQDCLPQDLLYIWADMISFGLDPKSNIRSESVTGHSYSKFDNTAPAKNPENLKIIQRYAGPNGSVSVSPV